MQGVEAPIVSVVGVEEKVYEPVALAVLEPEFVEDAGVALPAVEIQIRSDFFGGLVQDVQRPVHIVYEETISAAGLIAEEIDAGKQARDVVVNFFRGAGDG